MVIFAIGDSNNTPPPDGMAPLILLFLIVGIGAALGSQTGTFYSMFAMLD